MHKSCGKPMRMRGKQGEGKMDPHTRLATQCNMTGNILYMIMLSENVHKKTNMKLKTSSQINSYNQKIKTRPSWDI